jgi:hypothetical protein
MTDKPKKRRPTPAFDRSVLALEKLKTWARHEHWSAFKLRNAIRDNRSACAKVWRRALRQVFGSTSLYELPDFRQTEMF